jgi:signal transduction histidine kinase
MITIYYQKKIADTIREIDKSVIENGRYDGEEHVILPNGEQKIYLTSKVKLLDKYGATVGIAGASIDITDQKRRFELESQQAIINERIKVTQIIDVVSASIYWKDMDGMILGCNEYMLGMFGAKTRAEILGKTDYDLYSSTIDIAERIRAIDLSVLKHGYYEGEEHAILPNGERKVYFSVKTPLLDNERNVIGLVGASIDITAQKEAERLRVENEVNKSLLQEQEKFTKIAHQVVHDIRSPVASLTMILQSCPAIPEPQRIALREAATRINDIANNLLSTYNKDDIEAHSEQDIAEAFLASPALLQLITDKRYQYANLAAVKFEHRFTASGHFAFIQMGASSFNRMISNLINNAVDALNDERGTILVELDADAKSVIITISDNGKGMPNEVKEKNS